ncbi:MAG: malonic semialdehyde reductase [Acidobacteria bacterium]|nr:MAG: malonic semialdehyde reductase [Acidobacteriota bacterium]REK09181.1 MAG: malonic semialdehyde reductase [Acidobacteriota bacterium]
MKLSISEEAVDVLWREARTQNEWRPDVEVSEDQLRAIHELMKWGPTSGNGWPLRVLYVRSAAEKERLAETAMDSNAAKIRQAPVTAVLAHDLRFFDRMDVLFPHDPDLAEFFADNEEIARTTAFRNGTIQVGYFILAARAVGLDCGPMSGFSNDAVDELYFAGTSWRSNVLCSLGKGDPEGLFPRHPRPGFDEVSRIV